MRHTPIRPRARSAASTESKRLPALSTAWGLALIRVGFGVYFLVAAIDKTRGHWWTSSRPLTAFVHAQLPHANAWYRGVLQGMVLPHALLFSRLDLLGEWTAGVLLLLGLATPLGAVLVIWLNANYMLAKGLTNTAGSLDRLFVLVALVFLVSYAGHVLSVDWALRHPWTLHRRGIQGALVPPAIYTQPAGRRTA